MPTLVHLTDEKQSKKILNAGIKPGKMLHGIYCMPVLPNFYVSHQWLRELKSGGAKTFVGIYFRLPSAEKVYAGKYNERHRHITLGEAIKEIMTLQDPLGYELIIDRKIEASEIKSIKHLPQTLGWRYMPDSHNRKPCNCEFCLRGIIKGNCLRKRLEDEGE